MIDYWSVSNKNCYFFGRHVVSTSFANLVLVLTLACGTNSSGRRFSHHLADLALICECSVPRQVEFIRPAFRTSYGFLLGVDADGVCLSLFGHRLLDNAGFLDTVCC
jgi:hypothetical protein